MKPDTFDVIIVGAGGSGLAAAVSAAQRGGRVLVLEKQREPGGTTGIAVGSFTAAGTSLQRRAKIKDHHRIHAEDAGRFAPAVIEARNMGESRAFFLEQSADTFEWLLELGLTFVGPHPEPPNRERRMHNVVPGAKAYIAQLQLQLVRHRGEILCDAVVVDLLCDRGTFVGVRAMVGATKREFLARNGVVLAAGDYASNASLIAKHKGTAFGNVEGINPGATGDGHALAERAGAKMVNMDVTYGPELRFVSNSRHAFRQWLPTSGPWCRILGWLASRTPRRFMNLMIKRLLVTWQHPEDSLFIDGAILVNKDGRRFVDETDTPARELQVAVQPGKVAYILLDQRLHDRYSAWPNYISTAPDIAYAYVADYLRLRTDVTHSAPRLDQVAERSGVDATGLTATVEQWNQVIDGIQADPFGRKPSGSCSPLNGRRWLLLGPVKAYFTTTEGGAMVDRQMRVLDREGGVIPGLYAVGQNGLSGMILWSHGLHIAWAMTSGRLAGEAVMRADSERTAAAGDSGPRSRPGD
jgi:fumarate reductase flavoprotein subunit